MSDLGLDLDYSLSTEQRTVLLEQKIGCTSGLGTGICSMAFAFSANPLVALSASSAMLDDDEIRLLRSYVEFKASRYRPGYLAKFKSRCPVVEGACTVVFIKGPSPLYPKMNGWAYRKATWVSGPLFFPWEGRCLGDLIQEEIESGSAWLDWCKA